MEGGDYSTVLCLSSQNRTKEADLDMNVSDGYRLMDHPFVDGIFVPDGSQSEVIISSTGLTFNDCPPTSEWTWFKYIEVFPDESLVDRQTMRLDGLDYRHTGIGKQPTKSDWHAWHGRIDDCRMYDKALTSDELEEVKRGEPWLAWKPQPTNGATTDVIKGKTLSWAAGDNAVHLGSTKDPYHCKQNVKMEAWMRITGLHLFKFFLQYD